MFWCFYGIMNLRLESAIFMNFIENSDTGGLYLYSLGARNSSAKSGSYRYYFPFAPVGESYFVMAVRFHRVLPYSNRFIIHCLIFHVVCDKKFGWFYRDVSASGYFDASIFF